MEGKVDQLVALLTERMAAEGTPMRGEQSRAEVTPERRGAGASAAPVDDMTPRL